MNQTFEERLEKIVGEFTDGNKSKFAKLLNMTPQTFNNYVQGNRKPGWDVIRRFLAIGININYLVAGIPPIKTTDIKKAQVSKFTVQDSNLADEMAEEFADQENQEKKDKEAAERVEHFFRDVNTENLNSREANLLAEVKRFSYFLESRRLNPQVKRVLLELLIESIDQAIEQPQHDPAPSDDD